MVKTILYYSMYYDNYSATDATIHCQREPKLSLFTLISVTIVKHINVPVWGKNICEAKKTILVYHIKITVTYLNAQLLQVTDCDSNVHAHRTRK